MSRMEDCDARGASGVWTSAMSAALGDGIVPRTGAVRTSPDGETREPWWHLRSRRRAVTPA